MFSAKAATILLLLAFAGSVSCQAQCPDQMDADVLILGAGMAGLGAAETLSENGIENFLIIEQRDLIGGRVQTAKFGGGIVELGPQWVLAHDREAPEEIRQPLLEFVDRCNVSLREIPLGALGRGTAFYNSRGENVALQVGAEVLRFRQATTSEAVQEVFDSLLEDEDLPVSQALRIAGWNPRSAIEESAEYISFDLPSSFPSDRASTRIYLNSDYLAMRNFAFGTNPAISIVVNYPEGYYAIPKCLADGYLVENDPRLILSTAIEEIEWGDDCICAISTTDRRFCAPYAIVTFSLGELQNGFVKFTPQLPMIKNIALNQFEMGHFLKVYVAFNDTFWDTDVDIISHYNEERGREYYPLFLTWGAQFPEPTHVLEAVVLGLDESKRIAYQDPEITRQEIAQVMRGIYGDRASDPVDIIVNDFIANEFFFGNILTVPVGVGPRQFDELNSPCGNLYFSGDAGSFVFRGTVHGSLIHGRETAARIVEILQGSLQSKCTPL